jgi:hypothetical protein
MVHRHEKAMQIQLIEIVEQQVHMHVYGKDQVYVCGEVYVWYIDTRESHADTVD